MLPSYTEVPIGVVISSKAVMLEFNMILLAMVRFSGAKVPPKVEPIRSARSQFTKVLFTITAFLT